MQTKTVNGTTFEILTWSDTHAITRVITRSGRMYQGSWAIDRDEAGNMVSPTLEEVQQEWKVNRRSFDIKGCI